MSEWTVDTLREHLEALRQADQRALQIKERGDRDALQLAREIQTYKDEKANELRSQIERERGSYASKDDLAAAVEKVHVELAPLTEYVTAQRGRREGIGVSTGVLFAALAALGTIIGIIVVAANAITG